MKYITNRKHVSVFSGIIALGTGVIFHLFHDTTFLYVYSGIGTFLISTGILFLGE
jgi:uncharacterized membrane protein HdeD (DUF308 family)